MNAKVSEIMLCCSQCRLMNWDETCVTNALQTFNWKTRSFARNCQQWNSPFIHVWMNPVKRCVRRTVHFHRKWKRKHRSSHSFFVTYAWHSNWIFRRILNSIICIRLWCIHDSITTVFEFSFFLYLDVCVCVRCAPLCLCSNIVQHEKWHKYRIYYSIFYLIVCAQEWEPWFETWNIAQFQLVRYAFEPFSHAAFTG